MARITGAVRRDDTIQRLGGEGDNWHPTWGADGSLYVALCDGTGFPGFPRQFYNSRLCRVEGSPETGLTFHDVPGYPDLYHPLREPFVAGPPSTRYYGFGTISVDGTIYQYLNTWCKPEDDGTFRFVGTKLIYSPDGGTTWHNQDGSTPVHWEDWDEQSRETLVFLEEDESFSLQGILQMGQDYSLNTDGYVYVYSPNGNTEGTMNELVLFRVPKDRILDRDAYEFFVERTEDGGAEWSSDITAKRPVHTFPSGWVNTAAHPYAWQANVSYNPGLGLYLMGNWATGPDDAGMWFGKPSYMSFLQAPTPWGPWEVFYEDDHWTPGGDEAARCYQPIIVPKWISEDGRSFWMIWTDFQEHPDAKAAADAQIAANPDLSDDELAALNAALRPYYAFNVQRVDLTVE